MKRRKLGWLFVGPASVHLLVFALFPMAYALWISLHNWDILRGDMVWAGLNQYQSILNDSDFLHSLKVSGLFTLLSVPLGMAVSLLVAIGVTAPLKGMSIFRTLYYIPSISSGVAVAMLWVYVYMPQTGMIASLLAPFGITTPGFLDSPNWALVALAVMSVITGLGPRMVIYSAGLLSLPQDCYEAAMVDGAGKTRTFWKITLPLLAPTHTFVAITGCIGAFQVFTPVYIMTQGGPLKTTDVVGFHIYETAWRQFDMSKASAQSFVLLVILAVLTLLQYAVFNRKAGGYASV